MVSSHDQAGAPRIDWVVVVDDDPDDRLIARERLLRSGAVAEVTCVDEPEQTVAVLEELTNTRGVLPDLLVLDVMMPTLDAFSLLGTLGESPSGLSGVPVVLLTNSESAHDQRRAAKYPAVVEYLVKPITAEDVDALVQRFGLASRALTDG